MDITAADRFKRGQRAAALWVAAVGAVLVVAAAALFVAVRWNDLPPEAKLAVMLGLTGAFLLAGFSVRRTLPTTGSVLYHLGAFLLPIDLAAINLRIGLRWEELLLAEGILGIVSFTVLGLVWRSSVLRWAASASVVAAALGLGGTTPIPAALALAVTAAAFSIRQPRSAPVLAWATIAGFAPVYSFLLDRLGGMGEQLAMLGLDAARDPVAALATGALATAVLLRTAHLERDVGLVFLGLGAFAASTLTAWLGADVFSAADTLAVPSVFVAIEIFALVLARDAFWSRPARWIASGAEVAVGFFALGTLGFVALAPLMGSSIFSIEPDGVGGVAFAILALGSAICAVRYAGTPLKIVGRHLAAVAAATFAITAVQIGTASTLATGSMMVAGAATLFLLRHPLTDAAAGLAAIYAPLTAHAYPAGSFLFAGASAAALVASAISGSRAALVAERWRRASLISVAVLTVGIGSVFGAAATGGPFAGLAFVLGCWLIAFATDFIDRSLAYIPRIGALLVLFAAGPWTSSDRLIVVATLVALLALDAIRNNEARQAFVAIVPLQVVVGDLGLLAGLRLEHAGIVVSVGAVVWAGLAEAVGGRWRDPLRAAAIVGTGVGMVMAAGDPAAFGATMLVAGGLGVAAGLVTAMSGLTHAGGVALTIGTWIELATGGVAITEAYVAPVACHLVLAGMWARRNAQVSSWAAYAPSVAMLGGAGVIERIAQGSGWHALLAGSVGVVAVAVGGSRRLAGPLITGTALLGVVVGYESLAVVATVPTWGWLALGGSALLATGIALERADTSPVEAGRRVVDVIAANFD
jgi:hypothetical protein